MIHEYDLSSTRLNSTFHVDNRTGVISYSYSCYYYHENQNVSISTTIKLPLLNIEGIWDHYQVNTCGLVTVPLLINWTTTGEALYLLSLDPCHLEDLVKKLTKKDLQYVILTPSELSIHSLRNKMKSHCNFLIDWAIGDLGFDIERIPIPNNSFKHNYDLICHTNERHKRDSIFCEIQSHKIDF